MSKIKINFLLLFILIQKYCILILVDGQMRLEHCLPTARTPTLYLPRHLPQGGGQLQGEAPPTQGTWAVHRVPNGGTSGPRTWASVGLISYHWAMCGFPVKSAAGVTRTSVADIKVTVILPI